MGHEQMNEKQVADVAGARSPLLRFREAFWRTFRTAA